MRSQELEMKSKDFLHFLLLIPDFLFINFCFFRLFNCRSALMHIVDDGTSSAD